ncbi:MAG: hypothetical protein AB3N14_08925 [Flavobacteriaceae bacterium]
MKNILNSGLYLFIGCIFALVFAACEASDSMIPDTDPDSEQQIEDDSPEDEMPEDDPDEPDEPQPSNSSNEISEALKFNSAQLKTGSPPASSNLSELFIDKDTIKLWPGVRGRIRILNRDQIEISAILVHISGADGHHEVPIEAEESIDSVSVFYIDIDPTDLNLPHDGDIVISPIDPSGEVIDEFDHPLHIDPPFDEAVGAGPDGTEMGNCPPKMAIPYFWIYTTVDGKFSDAPGYPHGSSYETEGCCDRTRDPHNSVPCLGKPPTDKIVVNNQYSLTDEEFIKLFGTDFIYALDRSINNFDYDASDFCEGRAAYSFAEVGLQATGTSSFTPANGFETFYEFTIHTMDVFDRDSGVFPRIGPNENGSPAYINCNYLIVTSLTEGSITTKVFERQPEGENWHS